MNTVNISVVLNVHREGLVVGATIKSLVLASGIAAANGIGVEVVCVLDRGDERTREIVNAAVRENPEWRILEVEHGDLGLSRNSGVAVSRGDWIAFIDGDDLWGKEWLSAAYSAAAQSSTETIWHPELNLYFGARPHLFLHIDMEDIGYNPAALAFTNLWTALCFVNRSTLLKTPYRASNFSEQIGFEDWDWNIQTIRNGATHKVVRGTCHAIRTRANSLVQVTTASGCLPRGNSLFRQIVEDRKATEFGEDFLIKVSSP